MKKKAKVVLSKTPDDLLSLKTQELIDLYIKTYGPPAFSGELKNITAALIGRKVNADITWPNGRVTDMNGEIISIRDYDVFIQTSIGPVAGDTRTMEADGD